MHKYTGKRNENLVEVSYVIGKVFILAVLNIETRFDIYISLKAGILEIFGEQLIVHCTTT